MSTGEGFSVLYLIKKRAAELMEKVTAHGFSHVERVRQWALQIAQAEDLSKKEIELLELAALLHDIGRSKPGGNHGKVGAEIARELLSKEVDLSPDEIERICFAIANHNSVQPVDDIVALVLRDADMLDQLGSAGLVRCLSSKATKPFFPEGNPKGETWGLTGEQFNYRLDVEKKGVGVYIVDQINFQISRGDCMNTETARRLAEPKVKFLKRFLIGLEKEGAIF